MTRPHPLATLRRPADRLRDRPEVTNIAVRVEDFSAFLGVICAREKLIEKKIDRFVARDQAALRLTGEVANCALDAFIAISSAEPDPAQSRTRLELTAAMAIAALVELERTAR